MKKIVVVSVLALLLVGIGGYFGMSYWARHQVDAQIEQALASIRATGARAAVGKTEVSVGERSLVLTDLSFVSADGNVTLTVGKIAARDAAPPRGERITAGSVAVDDLKVSLKGTAAGAEVAHQVPHLAITGYSGPLLPAVRGDGTDLMNVLMAQLAGMSAETIAAPRTVTRISPPADAVDEAPREITAETLSLTGVDEGRVAKLAIARLTAAPLPDAAAVREGQGSGLHAQVSDIAVTGIDLKPLLQGAAAGTGFVQVLQEATTGQMVVEEEDGRTELAGVRFTGLAMAPEAFTPARIAALNAINDAADDAVASDQQITDALAVISAVRFTRFEARELRSTEPSGNGHVAVLTLEGLDAGVLAQLALEGVDGDEDGRSARVGRIALTGLDLGRAFRFAHSAEDLTPDAALGAFRLLSGITVNNVEVPTGGEGAPSAPIRIGTFALSWGDLAGDLPTRIRLDFTDVSGPIGADDGEPFTTLAAAGLTRATVSLAFGAAYDAAASSVRVAPMEMEVKDAFRLKLDTTLTQLPAAALASEEAMTEALPGVNLGPTTLTITDLGLARLVMQRMAEAEGVSVDEYRAALVQLLQQLAGDLAKTNPEAADVGAALAAFIENPHTLTLTATPKGPVPLLALMNSDDPEVPLQLFTFSVTNTP